MATSLRSRQTEALRQLINLNAPLPSSKAVEPVWKILIFDAFGQDILSPLISVKELRELGVTLHLRVDSSREALPDVPAVYFLLPSQANVATVCGDLEQGLYDSYHLNFISALPRPRLEELASTAVHAAALPAVKKVFDQYLNFISLEEDLFSLRRSGPENPLSFYAIHQRGMEEEQMNGILEAIADQLFSVCVTHGSVPIIRCPRGNAAEQVAERLERKLRDNLRDTRNNLFAGEGARLGALGFQRPLLLILDRSQDLATPLHHTWTYQALVHDVLELELNRVLLPGSEGAKAKEYDLNTSDRFWLAQKGAPFPAVAEAVQGELDGYRSSEEEIRKLKSAMGLEGSGTEEAVSMMADTTSKLTSTVSSLPELLEKKRLIDQHMNLATALLEAIKARKLDRYFEAEEKLLQKTSSDRSALQNLLSDPLAGTPEDKIRLILQDLIYAEGDETETEVLLSAAGLSESDAPALNFLRLSKRLGAKRPKGQTSEGINALYSGMGTKTISMFPKLLSQGSAFVMEGVKNLVNKRHNLPVTKLTEAAMELKEGGEVDDYRYLDPKLLRPDGSAPRSRTPFQEAIVFVVGGGNYAEYQNLVDYAKGNNQEAAKRITYGTTELINSHQFLAQLNRLGAEM